MENKVSQGGGGKNAGEGEEIGDIVDLFMGCIREFWPRRSGKVTEVKAVELRGVER